MAVHSIRIQFDKLLGNTDKAILVRIYEKEIWIPKSVCRKLVVNNKLGGNVGIPVWLAEREGLYIDDSKADVTIEHHTPSPKDKTEIKHDDELFR